MARPNTSFVSAGLFFLQNRRTMLAVFSKQKFLSSIFKLTASALVFLLLINLVSTAFIASYALPANAQEVIIDNGAAYSRTSFTVIPNTDIPSVSSSQSTANLLPSEANPATDTSNISKDKNADTNPADNTTNPKILKDKTKSLVEESPEGEVSANKSNQAATSAMSATGTVTSPDYFTQPQAQNKLTPKVDNNTGALIYDYSFNLPAGRGASSPDLSLSYNNQNAEDGSIFGYGWSLSLPYIERINKTGLNNLYSTNTYSSSIHGELVNTSGNNYSPKVQSGNFVTYALGTGFVMTDSNGVEYVFGDATGSRLSNSTDTKVYRWFLSKITDTNGNITTFSYTKDNNQIYPDKISYSSRVDENPIFEVSFIYETRTDTILSYKTGFDVKTLKRANQVLIKQNNVLLRKYDLVYASGSNTARSLLSSITETGYNESGVAISLPSTSFEYSTASSSWNYQPTSVIAPINPDYSDPVRIHKPESQLVDLNGDSYPDLWQSFRDIPNTVAKNKIYFSDTNNSWGLSNVASPVLMNDFEQRMNNGGIWDQGARIVDVNGDGLQDVLQSADQSTGVYNIYVNNQGTGFTQQASNPATLGFTELSGGVNQGSTLDYRARTMELNGDGLVDIYSNCFTSCNFTYQVKGQQFGTGTGFSSITQSWNMPSINNGVYDYFYGPHPDRTKEFDLNGDGLTDIVSSYTSYPYWNLWNQHAFLNKGDGSWIDLSQYFSPMNFYVATGVAQAIIMPVDINNDGLVDYVVDPKDEGAYFTEDNGTKRYFGTYLNTGNGFVRAANFDLPGAATGNSVAGQFAETALFTDLNADGLQDIVYGGAQNGANYFYKVLYRTGEKPDQLNKIILPAGGFTQINYKSSANYRNTSNQILNSNLPFVINTVSQITTNDGLGNTQTTNYSYEGGKYYFASSTDRKLAGFHKVVATDSAGNSTTTYFHQGDASNSLQGEFQDSGFKIGKPYKIEQKDNSGNVYTTTINKWDEFDLGSGSKFVKLAQTVEQTFDGNLTHKDKAESYFYNNTNGNTTQKITWGEVSGNTDGSFTDIGTDKLTTDYSYATGSSYGVVGAASLVTTSDISSVKVNEIKYYYDNLPWASVSKGNQTKQEQWKSGANYITTTKTYNSYGLVTNETDGRGKNTNYTYDTFNLYPSSITNALNQATSYLYDYSVGKPKQVTDVNGFVYQTIYDALDRVIEEKQPDASTPSNLVTKNFYTYTNLPVGNKVKKSSYLDSVTSVDSYTYTDGLDRTVQIRIEQETPGQFAVADTIYNNLGQVWKTSLPYISAGEAKTTATVDSNLLNIFTYDPVGRPLLETNILGSTSTSYAPWKISITDARGKLKHLYKDAYGRLVKVDEVNGAATYTTVYEYNSNGNLVKITDALGNVRQFVYDGVSRRILAEDLHAAADTSFGIWQYVYDDAGNITQVINPNNQTINSSYDDLNRKLSEDFTGQAGTEKTYVYDSCVGGIGKVCIATSTGTSAQSYQYDALGKISREIINIDSVNYQTDYTYNREGAIVTIKNPDNSEFKNNYNTAGQLESTQRKESTDSTWQNVVTNFDYGPHGGVTVQANANGTTTTNTYDPTKLYRLTRKVTTGLGGGGGNQTTVNIGATTGDGSIVHNSSTAWATTRDALTGSTANSTSATAKVSSGKVSGGKFAIERSFVSFDTSSLPDNAIVLDAKLKLYIASKTNNDNDGDDWVTIVQGNQPSTTSLATADYDLAGSINAPVEGINSSERKDISNVTTAQYLTFNLNGTGRSWVSLTSATKLALREGHDVLNSAYTGSNSTSNQLTWNTAEATGATTDPILEVTYLDSLPAPLTLQDISYVYDAVGNITQISDTSSTSTAKVVNYSYDDLNRLSSAVTASVASGQENYNESYTYDAVGNILTKVTTVGSNPSSTSTYSYQGNTGNNYANPHATTSISTVVSGNPTPQVTAFTYDQAGNTTAEGTNTYAWTYDNKLSSSLVSGLTTTYLYDPAGGRVKQTTGTNYTRYPSSFYNIDQAGKATKHLPSGDSLSLSIEGIGSNIQTIFNHTDHLGSQGLSTNSQAQILETTDYYPYGNLRISTPYTSFQEQRKYIGKEYDTQTNLSYLEARYYKASMGRFLSQDPVFWNNSQIQTQLLDPQSWNSYSYARGNPLRYKDPTGEFWDTVADLGFVTYDATKVLYHGTKALEGQISYHLFSAIGRQDIANSALNDYNSNIGQAKSATTSLGLDLAGTAVPGVTGLGIAGRSATKTDNVGRVAGSVENGYKKAANHVFRDHPERYPGLTKTQIENLAKETKETASVVGRVKGTDPIAGRSVSKQYYGSKSTGQMFINTNKGTPTMFPKNNITKYIKDHLLADINKFGKK